MSQEIHIHELGNGLVLVAEPMPWLESVAFSLMVPAGCARDPSEMRGLGNFTCEMVQRGCGDRDSRQFVEDLEMLGADTSAAVLNAHTSFRGAMPAESLAEALGIYADVVRNPIVPEDQIEDGRLVCLQEIRAVEDDLSQQVMIELRRRFYPDPYGRDSQGTEEAVAKIQHADLRGHFNTHYRPNGGILSIAGKFDWKSVVATAEDLFGSWASNEPPTIKETPADRVYFHRQHDSSQTHISVAYPSVPYSHDDYFQARGAVGVLSDGMSSRLFTEVREKRGLCYTVSASCHTLRDRGSVICYAGTTTERAQETLDVLIAELVRLSKGIEPDELSRLKARIKSALIIQQESSTSRSGAIALDWYYLGRVRTLDEVGRLVDGLTCESINEYLAAHPPEDFTVVTLGEKPLEMPLGIS